MKKTIFKSTLLLCATMVLTTSCNNENNLTESGEYTPFCITGTIKPLTRTPELNENGAGKFTDGDQNTLFFFTDQQNPVSTFLYTYGEKYQWSDLDLPHETTEITITACYPPTEDTLYETLLWDASDSNAQKDLLISKPHKVSKRETAAIPLEFAHALHKICIELTTDKTTITNEMEKDASISCRNVLPIAHINLKNGTADNANGNKVSFTETGKKAFFIIPPQAVGNIEIGIHINQKDFIYKLADKTIDGKPLQQLKGEHMLSLKIAVSNESFNVIGEEIHGWESQGEITDSIIF